MGGATAYDSRQKGASMKKLFLMVFGVAATSAIFVADALAVPPTIPAVPVSDYGDTLLSSLGTAVGQVFPYAAAITAFAIGVGLVRRWLGARKATKV
jgi:hypothetical protein